MYPKLFDTKHFLKNVSVESINSFLKASIRLFWRTCTLPIGNKLFYLYNKHNVPNGASYFPLAYKSDWLMTVMFRPVSTAITVEEDIRFPQSFIRSPPVYPQGLLDGPLMRNLCRR